LSVGEKLGYGLINLGDSKDLAYIFCVCYRLLLEHYSHILLRTLHTIMFIGLEMERNVLSNFCRNEQLRDLKAQQFVIMGG